MSRRRLSLKRKRGGGKYVQLRPSVDQIERRRRLYGADFFVKKALGPGPDIPSDLLVDTLQRTGSLLLWVTGESMSPLLKPGDQISVVPCTAQNLLTGDVALLVGSTLVVHRFLYASKQGVVAKGDRVDSFDPPRSLSAVVGRVTARIRNGEKLRIDCGWPRLRGHMLGFLWCIRHRGAGFVRSVSRGLLTR